MVDLLDEADWVGISPTVLGELWIGFLAGRQPERNEQRLKEFLAHPVVEALTLDQNVSRLFAEITLDLKAAGTPIPTNDIWIAASAARVGATVLTYDEHFRKIHRVGSRILPVP